MKLYTKGKTLGFTIIELMVVISIVVLLVSIVLASIVEARENTREKKRVSDLANIELALTLYKEKNGSYPSYPNGIELGTGGALDSVIRQYAGNVYADPLSEGSGSEYGYWYYSNFNCNGESRYVIAAKKMEQEKNANFDEVCGGGSASIPEQPRQFSFIPTAHAGGGGGGGGGGATTCTVDSFTVSPSTLPYGGGSVTFNWRTTRAGSVSISPGVGSGLAADGSRTRAVTQTTTYTLTGNGSYWYGDCTRNVTVTVAAPAYAQSAYYTQASYAWGGDTSALYIVVLK